MTPIDSIARRVVSYRFKDPFLNARNIIMNRLISATFEVEGKIIHVEGESGVATAPTVDEDLYDELGYSLSPEHGVLYRNRQVDEFILGLSAGDEFERRAAADVATRFAVLLPNRDYTDEEKRLVTSQRPPQYQWATGYTGGMRFVDFKLDGQVVSGAVVPVLGFDPFDDYLDVANTLIRQVNESIGAARRQAARDAAGQTAPGVSPGG